METEEEVDILMSSDVYSATLSTKSITFSRSQIGWLFREDKTVSPMGQTMTQTTELKKSFLCLHQLFFYKVIYRLRQHIIKVCF